MEGDDSPPASNNGSYGLRDGNGQDYSSTAVHFSGVSIASFMGGEATGTWRRRRRGSREVGVFPKLPFGSIESKDSALLASAGKRAW